MFHRKMTTRANKKAARVENMYFTTSSSEPLYILRDFFMHGYYFSRLVIRHIVRKLFKVRIFEDKNITLHDIEPQLRALDSSRSAVEWAKSRGYLSDKATADNLPLKLLNKAINLHFLHNELGAD